jgi:phytol kinase
MDITGLLISYLYVGLILGTTVFIQKRFGADSFNTRKIVHISVSNWWLILIYFFTRIEYAVIGPISFIIMNYLSYRYHLLPAMELKDNRKNLGTVYFPLSLLILVILGYTNVIPLAAGGIGILVLGYGDGLAALLGKRFGKRRFSVSGGEKSILGTVTMVVVSALVVLITSLAWFPGTLTAGQLLVTVLGTAIAAAAIELFTPWGIDNITVPLGTAGIYLLISGVWR